MLKIFITFLLLFNFSFAYSKIKITVSIEPYKYLVERIGKTKVRVKSIYKNSKIINNHSQYELRQLAKADFYMTSFLPLEKDFSSSFRKFNNKIKVIDLSFNVKRLKKSTGELNDYIWVDPINLKMIADNILFELVLHDKKNEKYYNENYEVLLSEIDEIFLRIKRLYNKSEKYSAYIFDERWGYFQKRYNLSFYLIKEEIIKSNNLSKILKFTKEKHISLLLTKPEIDYEILSSVANNTNTKIIEHDIYKYSIFSNLYNLGSILFTKKR